MLAFLKLFNVLFPFPLVGIMQEKLLNFIYAAIAMVWVILFVCWVDALSEYKKAELLTPNQFVLALGSVPILYVVAITIHEAGHWFCGLQLGFIGIQFTVLWLNIERHGTRWKLRWAKRPAKLNGMVVQYPSGSKQLRLRKFLSVAAGPVANWVTGGLALALAYGLTKPAGVVSGSTQLLIMAEIQVFALISTFMGCFNLLPKKLRAGLSNDGLLMWRLWRREPSLSRALAVSALLGSSYAGQRPRDWDGTLLDLATAHTDNTLLDGSAIMLAYSHQLDANRPVQARPLLYACLDKLALFTEEQQQQIWCEVAYFEARHSCNAALAQDALTQAQVAKPFAEGEGNFARAEVAWASGDYEAARVHLQQVEAEPLVENENDLGNYMMALDRLADLRNRLALWPDQSPRYGK